MAVILLSAFIVPWYSQGHRRTATAQRPHTGTLGRLDRRRGGGSVVLQPTGGRTVENHDSGADQCRSMQRKARQQGWTESDNRQGQGSTALRWIGADRAQQGGAHKGDPVGSGRLASSARRSTGKEHKQTARRAGTDSTRTPQEDEAHCLLCA